MLASFRLRAGVSSIEPTKNKPEIGTSRKQVSDVSIRAKAGTYKKHRMSVPEALSGATSWLGIAHSGTEMTQERSFIALSLVKSIYY